MEDSSVEDPLLHQRNKVFHENDIWEESNRRYESRIHATRRNKVRKRVKEVYIRDDITCGITNCMKCSSASPGILSNEETDRILILNTDVAVDQIDFIADDPCVDNVVLLTTVLKEVRHLNVHTHARLISLAARSSEEIKLHEQEDSLKNETQSGKKTSFYVFSNEFARVTFVTRLNNETSEEFKEREVLNAARWYASHAADCDSRRVILLTASPTLKGRALEMGLTVMNPFEYVQSVHTLFPNSGEKLAAISEEDAVCAKSSESAGEKKAYFKVHLSEGEITRGIQESRYFQGILRMARGTCFEGYITHKNFSADVRIFGSQDLNRAIDGDDVAFEIIEPLASNIEACNFFPVDDEGEVQANEETLPPVALAQADSLNEASSLVKAAEEPHTRTSENERRLGRIVGIIKRNWREYFGTLSPLEEFKKIGEKVVNVDRRFIPADPRIPFINIKTRVSPELEGKRIKVKIDSWDRFSRHPKGHWISIIGNVWDKDTEGAVILHEHGIITREFSEAVLRCLPPADWNISDEDIRERLDLRDKVVFSVDPPGCKDIDDALCAENLPNGNIMIGVHIADVTHFITEGTAIDLEAAERCTTVYLVDKRTDMLPGLLTTDLCSLVSDKDRLTFSVLWEIQKDGKIVDTQFKKAIIRSRASLTYAQAQLIIDDPNDNTSMAESLRILNATAKTIRKARFENGALELASPEVRFELDSETLDPTDVAIYQIRDTNKMIEEFMLLANQSVAKFILSAFPSSSVLRRHPPPKHSALAALSELLETNNFHSFSFNTSKELGRSLNLAAKVDDPFFNRLLRILTTRCMNQAIYFCTGRISPDDYFHYGLAVPLYTHFTSPIRRYADVLVHRLLAAALGIAPISPNQQDKLKVESQCELMNEKHRNARFSGRASIDLYTFLYFRQNGPAETDAIIITLRQNGIRVFIPRYGIEGVIMMDAKSFDYDVKNQILRAKEGTKHFNEKNVNFFRIFDHVWVKIEAIEKLYRNQIYLQLLRRSNPEEIKPVNTHSIRQNKQQILGSIVELE